MKQLTPERNSLSATNAVLFDKEHVSPTLCRATVTVPAFFVDTVYQQACLSQKKSVKTHGFNSGEVPLEYIQANFNSNLTEHLKEFLFKYFVFNFLYQKIHENKMLVVGDPRLVDISVQPNQDASFVFDLSLFPSLEINDWKYLPFKAPKRKNYKDLDRQVDSFIKKEREQLKKYTDESITIGDWVAFDVTLVDTEHNPILGDHTLHLWLKMGDEEADHTLVDLFLGKNINDSFFTKNLGLQNYLSSQMGTNYDFKVTIAEVLPYSYFCLDTLKRHFKLKTNKELFKKLIEVFSYRNDLSQRRSMAEEALKLLLSKHRFEIPNHLTLRKQKDLLEQVKCSPDYQVYRMQKGFQNQIRQLAEKLVRESTFLDQLAYHENIAINNQDIKDYLNLTNRPRTKEFLYFDQPETKIRGQEIPMPVELLKQYCLREKTLNHIIYHLTKK